MTVWVNLGCMLLGVYQLVVVTMPYGCITLSLAVAHLAILRTAHDRLLVRYIGEKRNRRDGHHMLSCADALVKIGCQNVETTVRKRSILFAGFVARMGNEKLPKRVMFGQVDGGKGCSGGQEQDRMDCREHDLPGIVVQHAHRSETMNSGSQ